MPLFSSSDFIKDTILELRKLIADAGVLSGTGAEWYFLSFGLYLFVMKKWIRPLKKKLSIRFHKKNKDSDNEDHLY